MSVFSSSVRAAAFVAAAVLAGLFDPTAAAAQGTARANALPSSAAAQPSFDPALADRGKRIYTSNCARCHGLNMVSTGAGFFDLRTFPADDKPRFLNSVKHGKRAMPAWGERLQDDEIESLWAYVNFYKPKK